MTKVDIYSGKDPRDLPAYTYAQASRILDFPSATIRAWVVGTTYKGGRFRPVISRPDEEDSRLSFLNLVEAHVLRALRLRHRVPMGEVRQALDYAEHKLGVERLLIREKLRTADGHLFLEKFGELVHLSPSKQAYIETVLRSQLQRVEYDRGSSICLFPVIPGDATRRTVQVSPSFGFGDPVTSRRRIRTSVIADRFDAGETIEDLAEDYDLEIQEVRDAITFEAA